MDFMPVGDIINEKISFFIPYYQRGYKWEEHQVKALLDDFWNFCEKVEYEKDENYKYYSLQPLVVVKMDEKRYKVVDGQQRLTTIYIILKAFKNYLEEEKDKYTFEIDYERGSKELLKNIEKEADEFNLDYCYMKNAYNTVFEWIEEKGLQEQDVLDLRNIIVRNSRKINGVDRKNNIRFIWYEIDEKDEFDVFIRLNIGRIPLTNTELIKSFLLQRESSLQKRLEFSKEWDEVEYTLENDEFFGFLSAKDFSTRMEVAFQVLLNKTEYKEYELYEAFIKKYKDFSLEEIWDEVRKVFYLLKFWYEDREFYHLIGYLISVGVNINKIFVLYSESENKKDFKNKLKELIKRNLNIKVEEIETLSYLEKEKVHKVLLLFNVLSLINSTKDVYVKFSFDKFKREKWSIEHITPQTDKIKEQDFNKIKEELKKLNLNLNFDLEFDEFRKNIEKEFSDFTDTEEKHNIQNLTLLPRSLNSSLKNNFFPVKRNYIVQKDKDGEFVPIATKNLFLKYYSDAVKNDSLLKWSKDDGKRYVEAIKNTLGKFLEGDENGN